MRPVCPEAPVWPVEPLAPASSHNASHCVTCLPFSAQSSDSSSACNMSSASRIMEPPESEPTCETRLPGSPGLACGAACPCKQSQCLTLCHMPPFLQCKALIALAMPAFILMARQSLQPTCETRLPRSPGLACGAACPCKHSQCLTLCHMPPLLSAKL